MLKDQLYCHIVELSGCGQETEYHACAGNLMLPSTHDLLDLYLEQMREFGQCRVWHVIVSE